MTDFTPPPTPESPVELITVLIAGQAPIPMTLQAWNEMHDLYTRLAFWTQAPPSEPGMYQVYSQGWDEAFWLEIWRGIDGGLYATVDGEELQLSDFIAIHSPSHWIGPMPEQAPPSPEPAPAPDTSDDTVFEAGDGAYQVAIIGGERVKIDRLTKQRDADGGIAWLAITNTGESLYLTGGVWVTLEDGIFEYHVPGPNERRAQTMAMPAHIILNDERVAAGLIRWAGAAGTDEPRWLVTAENGKTYHLRGGEWSVIPDGLPRYQGLVETPATETA